MEERRERRLYVKCPITIEEKQGVRQGTLFNLSQTGGAIECGTPVQSGTVLTLRVHLPSLKHPISVDQAEVIWAAGDDFGVQFVQFEAQERERLNQVIADLVQSIQQRQFHQIRTC